MEEIVEELLTNRILTAVKNRNAKEIREIFETVPNIDIAEALDEVDDAAVFLYIFRTVTSEYTGDFFTELTTDQQEMIINAFTDKQLIDLLENSFADDIVDTLEEMPANVVARVLKACPADLRKDVNNLLNYKENTAGSVMTTEYLDMKDDLTVKEALKIIRKRGKDAETVYTVFVRDSKRNLMGTINLDDLIFADEDEVLSDIMDRDFVTCNVNDDQEEVANMFKRYDLNAMAVVNNENKIIGIITIDDVVDIIVEEATEDIAHLNQISNMDEPYLKTPVYKLIIKCVPWLITLIVLQLFSALIISGFEEKIATLTILSFFMTLVADAGGNAGGQTTTLIVRSISLDEFDKGDFWRVVWKELRVALSIAGIIAVFSFGWVFLETFIMNDKTLDSIQRAGSVFSDMSFRLVVSGLVASTLFVAMVVSRMIACILPFLAKALKLDPAVVCGPFTTTIVDVITLLTYFLLWTFAFGPMLGL